MALHNLEDVKQTWRDTRQIFADKERSLGIRGANEAIQNEAPSILVSMSMTTNDLLLLIAQDLAAIRSYMEDDRDDG